MEINKILRNFPSNLEIEVNDLITYCLSNFHTGSHEVFVKGIVG